MSIRVVVADDFPLVRTAIVDGLESDPEIDVVGVAADGDDALRLAQEQLPDVLILDLSMPGMGGLGVVSRLGDERSEMRVLILTASEEQATVVEALSAGASGYITKRSTIAQLREAVITVHRGDIAMTPSLTANLLRAVRERSEANDNLTLCPRELDVLRCVAEGLTDAEIAQRLFISTRTVQAHLVRVRDKTGVRRRPELARWATENAFA